MKNRPLNIIDMKEDPSASPDNLDDKEIKKIDKLISKSKKMNTNIRKGAKNLKTLQKEVAFSNKRIIQLIGEYLDSFLILGFDSDGNARVISSANSNLEKRGLDSLLESYMTGQVVMNQLAMKSRNRPKNIMDEDEEDDDDFDEDDGDDDELGAY
jgi:hypothetical protein